MTSLDKIMNGIENENSLVVEPHYSLNKRITCNIEKAYYAVTGAYHATAERIKKAGNNTTDRLVSAYNARKEHETLLPFDYSTIMDYGSWSDNVYNYLQDAWGSASEKIRNLLSPYLGLSGHYSTVKAREYPQSKYKKGGFTLTDLLATISATALLMAILMPSLQRARRQAKAVVCQSNLRQWAIAFATNEEISSLNTTFHPVYDMWWSYVSNRKSFSGDCNDVLLCPMATKRGTLFSPLSKSRYGSTFTSWAWIRIRDCEPVFGSYGFNNQLSYDPQSRTIRFSHASSVPLLFDCTLPEACLKSRHDPPPKYEDMSIIGANDVEYPALSICINRHDGGINMLFADYSIRKVGLKELWTLKWHRDFDTTGPWTKAGGVKPEDWPKWMRNFKDY